MKPDPIDDLLSAYASQPLPPAPHRIATDVWRDIEQRRRSGFGGLIGLNWRELLQRPALALSALALALLVGLMPAALTHSANEAERARQSLHFEVFSPDMPSILVASARGIQR